MKTETEIKERASDKAFAKLLQINNNILSLQKDLDRGNYGGVSREEVQTCLNSELKELKVWEYITFLIEKNN